MGSMVPDAHACDLRDYGECCSSCNCLSHYCCYPGTRIRCSDAVQCVSARSLSISCEVRVTALEMEKGVPRYETFSLSPTPIFVSWLYFDCAGARATGRVCPHEGHRVVTPLLSIAPGSNQIITFSLQSFCAHMHGLLPTSGALVLVQ